ncbi:hypothetical protein KY285_007330 [Solanum tuberosum]|nr:hypothetical protein KY285_007330 [Solanum tuberosum]
MNSTLSAFEDLSVVETGVGSGGVVGGGGIGGGVDSTGGGAGNVGDTGVGAGGIGGGVGGGDIKTPYTLGKYSTDGGGDSGVIGVDGDGGGIGVGHDIRTPYTLGKYSIVGVGTYKVNSQEEAIKTLISEVNSLKKTIKTLISKRVGTQGHYPRTVDGLTVRPAGPWFVAENFPKTQSENLAKC